MDGAVKGVKLAPQWLSRLRACAEAFTGEERLSFATLRSSGDDWRIPFSIFAARMLSAQARRLWTPLPLRAVAHTSFRSQSLGCWKPR